MSRTPVPRKRRRRNAELRNSMRLGMLLVALTGVNVYVFFFRDDTSIRKILQPSSTGKVMVDEKQSIIGDRLPGSVVKTGTGKIANPAPDEGRVVQGKIGPSDMLSTVLAREGFEIGTAAAAVEALSDVFDPKLIRPGDGYAVGFSPEGTPELFELAPNPVVRYVVTTDADGRWRASKEEKAIEVRTVDAAGSIDSSLYESVQKAGESPALVNLIVELFAWDLNFYVDTHAGDRWKVIVEKQYLGGQFYKYGKLLAAEYGGKAGTFRAFYFNPTDREGSGRYYDEKGQAIAKAMLKSPLRYVRISSKFDRRRLHPILHRVKAHLGVDYAAPVGTPVWASAGGRVVEAAMKRGSGNTVVISHVNGLATRYYHLSRFAKGLSRGKLVKQKEVIGYVGTTGLSTGPHLHFSVTKNGAFIDPSKLQVIREASVPNRTAYLQAIKPRLATLESLSLVAVQQTR